MKIIKQGSLILLLAAFSFFSSAISAALDENPIKPYVPPKVSKVVLHKCKVWGAYYDSSISDCVKSVNEAYLAWQTSIYAPRAVRNPNCYIEGDINTYNGFFRCTIQYVGSIDSNGNIVGWGTTPVEFFGGIQPQPSKDTETCPPDDQPLYKVGPKPIDPSNPNSANACFPVFKPCPLGFYANAVTGSSGGPEECVPIQCPSKGTAVTNIKNISNVIPNGAAGTYCDGLCNYSIEAGGIAYQGQQFASGVSMGSQCGQSPVKGQKFTPLDKEKNCTEYELQGADATFLECNEGTIDEPVPDTDNPAPDVENAKVDENPVIDPFTGVECTTVDDKMSCVGGNITDAITKQTKDQAKLDAQRHNKLVEQQKDITAYVEEQQRKREDARKTDAVTMVEAIQEVNRTLQTSGGSTGGGTTGGTDEGVKGAIEGLGEVINETDVETDSTPSDGIESFYEPEYPNGFQDVWSKNKSLFDNSEMNQYLDSWKLSASGNPPLMNACFNMGFIDFGCSEFTIDPRIFPFLRIIMLVSAAFLCRALIFGG